MLVTILIKKWNFLISKKILQKQGFHYIFFNQLSNSKLSFKLAYFVLRHILL